MQLLASYLQGSLGTIWLESKFDSHIYNKNIYCLSTEHIAFSKIIVTLALLRIFCDFKQKILFFQDLEVLDSFFFDKKINNQKTAAFLVIQAWIFLCAYDA